MKEEVASEPQQEKPLHVQLAEALGTHVDCRPDGMEAEAQPDGSLKDVPQWSGMSATWLAASGVRSRFAVPHLSWSLLGPLIQRFGLSVVKVGKDDGYMAYLDPDAFFTMAAPGGLYGYVNDYHGLTGPQALGPTALYAIVALILALHADGKLKLAA